MEAETLISPIVTPSLARQRIRAISTTVGVVIISALWTFASAYLLFAIILPFLSGNTSGSFNGDSYAYLRRESFLVELLAPVLPAAAGGMYWLALRGLPRRRVRSVLLEVTGVGFALFLVTGILTNMIDIETERIFFPTALYTLYTRLSGTIQVLAQDPFIMLMLLLLAFGFAVVIVNLARFFSKRRHIDATPAPQQIWRDFALVWGLTTFITVAYAISEILLVNYVAMTYPNQQLAIALETTLLLLFYFFIPIGIVAVIACADGLHLLQNLPAAAAYIPPSKEDPFASSDGSFSLSYGPIKDGE